MSDFHASLKRLLFPREVPDTPSTMPLEDRVSLLRQLEKQSENLRLIEERKSEYVQGTDVPMQLVKDERRIKAQIAELEARLR